MSGTVVRKPYPSSYTLHILSKNTGKSSKSVSRSWKQRVLRLLGVYTSARRVSCRQAGVYASRVMHASMYVYIVHRCRHAALQHSVYTRTCCLSTYLSIYLPTRYHSFAGSLGDSWIHCFTLHHSFIHSFFHSFISFVHPIHSFLPSFMHLAHVKGKMSEPIKPSYRF